MRDRKKCVPLPYPIHKLLFNLFNLLDVMEERFYYCETCGNFMIAAIASGVIPYCCGDEMTLLKPNTMDGSKEKHVPVVTVLSDHCLRVKVGDEPHPMTPEHNIRFVCVETSVGGVIRYLDVGDVPEVTVRFDGKPIAVYAYCSIHGLWRADVPEPVSDPSKDGRKDCWV